jgi:peptidoglycan/LPS O-acetylase OafA/YrhL
VTQALAPTPVPAKQPARHRRIPQQRTAAPVRGPHRSLNALRAVAAILVVVYHLRTLLFAPGGGPLYVVTGLGPAAVLVFFVLSGYWVGGSVFSSFRKRRFSWSRYATARLSRLWIVLIPAVALTLLLDHAGLAFLGHTSIYLGDEAYHHTVPAGDLRDHLSPLAALGNIFFTQTIAVPSFGTNASLWSLTYEAVYYALLPLALSVWRGGALKWRILSAVLFLAVCAFAGPKVLMYFPVWLMGAAVALGRDRIAGWLASRSKATLALARAGAFVLLGGALWLVQSGYSTRNVLVLAAATTLVLVLLVQDVTWNSRVLGGLSNYAESSYSLYAVHLPVAAMIAALLAPQAAHRWAPTAPHWLALAGLLGGLIAFGWAFAWLTERHTEKLRAAVDRRLH